MQGKWWKFIESDCGLGSFVKGIVKNGLDLGGFAKGIAEKDRDSVGFAKEFVEIGYDLAKNAPQAAQEAR